MHIENELAEARMVQSAKVSRHMWYTTVHLVCGQIGQVEYAAGVHDAMCQAWDQHAVLTAANDSRCYVVWLQGGLFQQTLVSMRANRAMASYSLGLRPGFSHHGIQ